MHRADLHHSDAHLQNQLNRIFQLRRTRSAVNWDRDQFLDLLDALGNPHLSVPPVIHVAGTNGKGSVVAILRSILEAQGLRVHAYTSPHLIHVNERIVLAGEQIGNAALSGLIDQALGFIDSAPLSFFEVITAIAFRAFADCPADVLLLEVGMGGRLDCTNVVPAPLACVINRISMDHTEFLGETIEHVAREKAGIIKAGVPCAVGYQGDGVVYDIVQQKAQEIGAAVQLYGRDWDILEQGDDMVFTYGGQNYILPKPALKGAHQILNAGLALSALFSVSDRLKVSHDAMAQGLRNVFWGGRLQRLDAVRFGVADDCEIWLDAAHNDSAAQVLAQHIAQSGKRAHLVMGLLRKKKIEDFLGPLRPVVNDIHVVPVQGEDSYAARDIPGSQGHSNVLEAVRAIAVRDPGAVIFIAGSVYLAGEAHNLSACAGKDHLK